MIPLCGFLLSLALAASSVATLMRGSLVQTPLQKTLSTSDEIRAALDKAGIIPDVLDPFAPSYSLTVRYPHKHTRTKLGNILAPSAVSPVPDLYAHLLPTSEGTHLHPTPTARENVTYTLVLTDPDATSRADPVMGEMCHWIISATGPKLAVEQTIVFPASSPQSRLVSDQQKSTYNLTQLMSYLPPSPPPKTGLHRYVFVLLMPAASDGVVMDDLKKPKERPHWGYGKVGKGVRDWARDNELVAVGANFFYAENEKQ